MTKVTIRPAQARDEAELAQLAYRVYYWRFFDEGACNKNGVPFGAPLAKDFPELKAGQDLASFEEYWAGFMPGLQEVDPYQRSYCYVACIKDNRGTEQIIGFIKGYGAPLANDLQPLLPTANPLLVAELGSIYIDPNYQISGVGRALVSAYAAAMQEIGYQTMVTRCYIRNDSPEFFKKLGAVLLGECPIAVGYNRYDGNGQPLPPGNVTIPGYCLGFDAAAMAALTATARPIGAQPSLRL